MTEKKVTEEKEGLKKKKHYQKINLISWKRKLLRQEIRPVAVLVLEVWGIGNRCPEVLGGAAVGEALGQVSHGPVRIAPRGWRAPVKQ